MDNIDAINKQIAEILEQVTKLTIMVGIDPEEPIA